MLNSCEDACELSETPLELPCDDREWVAEPEDGEPAEPGLVESRLDEELRAEPELDEEPSTEELVGPSRNEGVEGFETLAMLLEEDCSFRELESVCVLEELWEFDAVDKTVLEGTCVESEFLPGTS